MIQAEKIRFKAEIDLSGDDLDTLQILLRNGWTGSKIFVVMSIIRSIVEKLEKGKYVANS